MEKCHGRKPKVTYLKRAKIWVAQCGCRCKIWCAGASNKKNLSMVWNDLVRQNAVEG